MYYFISNFCNVDKDDTLQLGIRKLMLLENATQELLNMKGELEENDKQYELKSGYIYFKYNLSCSEKIMGKSFRCSRRFRSPSVRLAPRRVSMHGGWLSVTKINL